MIFLFITILFMSITIHECAHGFVAYKLGDPTPKDAGRLTLNPLVHIDPFGTIILPILLFMLSRGTFSFGYAKPIPINYFHFKNPKKDILWVGAAGPAANFCLVLILTFLIKLIPAWSQVLVWAVFINLILGIFNLLPIPPLDGSRIVASLLPHRLSYKYLKLENIGFIIIILLIISGFFKNFLLPLAAKILVLLGIQGGL